MMQTEEAMLRQPVRSMLRSEDFVGARHKKVADKLAGLAYEFTRDPGYLHQYYILRARLLGKALGWHLETGEDPYDKRSHILVVRRGNLVVGGARIIIRSPRKNEPLLLETDGFDLIHALPQLKLSNKKYCEFSRFVLLEEFQHSQVSLEMFRRLYQKYTALNVQYGFSSVSEGAARVHRRICKALGVNFTQFDDVALPEKDHYEGRVMKLIMFDDHGLEKKPVADEFVEGAGEESAASAQEEV